MTAPLDSLIQSGSAAARKSGKVGEVPPAIVTAILLLAVGLTSCGKPPAGSIVLTQVPAKAKFATPGLRDTERPEGTRVVLLPGGQQGSVRVLSKGLATAGGPVLTPDGARVLFVGKRRLREEWQVYEVTLAGGRPKQITHMRGGAVSPAMLANGSVVFSSPAHVGSNPHSSPAAIYKQAPNSTPKRLTFGTVPAFDPTVLADGRILFVSPHVQETPEAPGSFGLFTINDDGTELTAFAADKDGAPELLRPRELLDGRVAFVSRQPDASTCRTALEVVRKARPFASRAVVFPFAGCTWTSVEADGPDALLACAEALGASSLGAVYRLTRTEDRLSTPVFQDPAWRMIEAVPVRAREAPTGHVSAMAPEKKTGTILCLDANFTRRVSGTGGNAGRAARVRVLAQVAAKPTQILGEVPVHLDGSFMAEVPADTPLGFETLDAAGQVLHTLQPTLWVRPGENRSCVGCHEPNNRSPRNVRPQAVLDAPAVLKFPTP